MKIEMETNLFGESVVAEESRAALSKKQEQGVLFENEVSAELQRERRLAQAHQSEGGKELFQG